jgi:hypothetical protein
MTLLSVLLSADIFSQETHVRLTNLPHVYLQTFNGYGITSTTNYVYARMWYVDETDQVQYFDSLQIRVRGNSTASLAKKPYKLKFNSKVKLLGKGYANTKKWTMLANHADKTLLRNALTSLMGERAGLKFNPAAKFVDVTLNGSYIGNYQISDQVDVRPHRVNIAEQDYPLSSSSNTTGGYLMEADGFRDFSTGWNGSGPTQATGFYSSQGVPVRVHYPDEEEINDTQLNYIQDQVNAFESRLFSSNFKDEVNGYRPYVDSLSLVRWYLCTEISANVDGFFSAYFYKERDDQHFFFGPLWDYDIAYNNDNRAREGTNNTTRQLMVRTGYGSGWGNGNRMWVERMWGDPWFARLVNREYSKLVKDGMEYYLYHKIDSLTTLLSSSQSLNYQRWGINQRTLREVVLYSTYDEYVTDVRNFIRSHIPYLTTTFASMLPDEPTPEPGPDIKQPDFVADLDYYYTIQNLSASTFVDVNADGDLLCANARDAASQTQQWRIKNLSNGYIYIRNRITGKALCDMSADGATATTLTGAQIALARPDSSDSRQQWDLVRQPNGAYNLISRFSQHAANLSGGNTANGTPILSYTSDERNSVSGNRMWLVEKADRAIIPTDIVSVSTDYALAYSQLTHRLHFAAEDMSMLTFKATVFNQSGHRIATFNAGADFDTSALPAGIYIVTWQHDGRIRSVKFVR